MLWGAAPFVVKGADFRSAPLSFPSNSRAASLRGGFCPRNLLFPGLVAPTPGCAAWQLVARAAPFVVTGAALFVVKGADFSSRSAMLSFPHCLKPKSRVITRAALARGICFSSDAGKAWKGVCLEDLVPEKGVEPSRACAQRILSPPRLPFRHSGSVPANLAD